MVGTKIKIYASPSCVLLAFDWPDGKDHPDFLGFAIERDPGYQKNGAPGYLLNKLDFTPITPNTPPKGSDAAPIQKFNWWDGGINPGDRGKTFTYTVTPVLGSGPGNVKLLSAASASARIQIPQVLDGGIASYFNRAVVSSQSFRKLTDAHASLDQQMDWLANGLQDAVPGILACGRARHSSGRLEHHQWP